MRGKIINAAHPFRRAAADGVAGEGGENVTVAQHDVTGAQQRDQLPFVTVGEIRRVNEAEGGGREQFALFSLAGGVLDQLGGIPFAEKDLEALQFQPAFEQINLGGFARAIQPFDRDQPAREIQFGKSLRHAQWENNKPPDGEHNDFHNRPRGGGVAAVYALDHGLNPVPNREARWKTIEIGVKLSGKGKPAGFAFVT